MANLTETQKAAVILTLIHPQAVNAVWQADGPGIGANYTIDMSVLGTGDVPSAAQFATLLTKMATTIEGAAPENIAAAAAALTAWELRALRGMVRQANLAVERAPADSAAETTTDSELPEAA